MSKALEALQLASDTLKTIEAESGITVDPSVFSAIQEGISEAHQQADDDSTPKCTVTWFTDGGRTEKQCPEPAEHICAACGAGRCDDHQGDSDQCLIFYQLGDGAVICDDCITDEQRALNPEEVSTRHR